MSEISIKYHKEDVKGMSDKQILDIIAGAKGHTDNTFKEYIGCDFCYSFLTKELQARGYENGWYKREGSNPDRMPAALETEEKEIVEFSSKKGECIRTTIEIDADLWNRWKTITEGAPRKGQLIEAALEKFLRLLETGKVEFRWTPGE